MSGVFADATSVARVPSEPAEGGPIRYTAEIKPGWDIGGNANGGYLLAIAGRAMADAVGRPPVTLTAHYLRPGPAGPCEVEVATVRNGRRFATATASLTAPTGELLRLLGTFGDPQPGGPTFTRETPVELPPYDEMQRMPSMPIDDGGPTLFAHLDVRMREGDGGFRDGKPTGAGEVAGWFRFADDTPIDPIALLFVADAFPPAAFNTGLPVAWVPTVELTVHIRAVPVPGPVRCVFRSRFVHDGLLDEEAEIWDSAGTLVCQSRQLALLPR